MILLIYWPLSCTVLGEKISRGHDITSYAIAGCFEWEFQFILSMSVPRKSQNFQPLWRAAPSSWSREHCGVKMGIPGIERLYSTLCPSITSTCSTSKFCFKESQCSVWGEVLPAANLYAKDCTVVTSYIVTVYFGSLESDPLNHQIHLFHDDPPLPWFAYSMIHLFIWSIPKYRPRCGMHNIHGP